MTRKYHRTSTAMRRLINYIFNYQQINKVAPTNLRAIGRGTGLSHTQVRRLRARAEEGGILRRKDPKSLSYEVITKLTTPDGVAWIPRIECFWSKPIKWVKDISAGVSLDRAVYGIRNTQGLWALTFPDSAMHPRGARLSLNSDGLALVRRCEKETARTGYWYIIECGGEVFASCLFKQERNEAEETIWKFRLSRLDKEPMQIEESQITGLALIEMVTMRPPSPKKKKGG